MMALVRSYADGSPLKSLRRILPVNPRLLLLILLSLIVCVSLTKL